MKIAVSYSGGKESALALHKAIEQGYEPILLITMYNNETKRSYSHGIDERMLEEISECLDIPLLVVKTGDERYAWDFENALQKAKAMGAEACVFGDVDIKGHKAWCSERCESAGVKPVFPLWGKPRKEVVYECIDSGFTANITTINTKYLSEDFLGSVLSRQVALDIENQGIDICGENGEYHTFVSDGSIFKKPIQFSFGEKIVNGDYTMLPIRAFLRNSHKFFNNSACKYFPCHKFEAEDDLTVAGEFNCMFCFCPLYAAGDKCGGKFEYDERETKSCLDCEIPHKPDGYGIIISKLKELRADKC